MDVLVAGGTGRGRVLAGLLVAAGIDVVSSLAGRTREPVPVPGQVRQGGFGGTAGLARLLTEERVRVVVDATHPFAATMSEHLSAACRAQQVPLLRLCAPSWRALPMAQGWTWVDDHDQAAAAAAGTGLVVLTVGRQPVPHYLVLGERPVIVRCVDPPEVDLPYGWQVLRARGPFTLDDERRLLAGAEVVVSKDSGGTEPDPKLVAAAEQGVAVVMVSRPAVPAATAEVATADEAAAWVRRRLLRR